MEIDYLIVIPARFKSSRFEGKPLADINGKSMIERVWLKCLSAAPENQIIVATDDKRIYSHCKTKKINTIMTSKKCLTGTDRLAEVSKKIKAGFYVNVQGDEPLINPKDIKKVINDFKKFGITNCAATNIKGKTEIKNRNIPKIVTDKRNYLLYISRADIPSAKSGLIKDLKKQVCIYSFSSDAIKLFGLKTKKTKLEEIEDIEILRVLENGIPVKIVEVESDSIAVDTPEDLRKVRKFCR
tara:strand:+ start:3708 stop:4430 length:723 start_codon:yes stop_codon:yes gene_type:complete